MHVFSNGSKIAENIDININECIIYSICVDNLSLSFSEIRDYVNSVGVKLTEEEITTFLKEQEKGDNKEKSKVSSGNKTKSQEFADNFMKELVTSTYEFSPTT